jgi:beta-exotoxin I transport system ATP-binding protein
MLETFQLTKQYGQSTALRDCTLAVQPGEVFGLLGPNGAGKTTLLRLLMGFLRPTAGWAKIDRLDCYRQSVAVHQRVAYLPGEVRLFPQLRGVDVLRFFAEVREGRNLSRSTAVAERLRLEVSKRVSSMSTGMRQKLALAVVFSADARLLILDEPTSNLDPTVRSEVLNLVAEARSEGRTVLFSSHIFSEVEQVCDRVAILRDGELVHTQVMAEVLRKHRIRAQLTGPLPEVPVALRDLLSVESTSSGHITMETPGELSPVLSWLATAPLREVHIEPLGLQAIYQRYHQSN